MGEPMTIINRLTQRQKRADSLLCVGLDSDLERIPAQFRGQPHPQFAFNQWMIDQTHEFVCAYKPNIAFYEARGEAGWRELGMTLDYLHANHPNIVTICDAKRGDIGNTNRGYVTAIFDDLGFDAITLHPYLGRDALMPFLLREDKACIILCRTSNPQSDELQALDVGGRPLWAHVAAQVREQWNVNKNCMLVVGATYPDDLRRAREIAPEMPFLVPGVGAQGGDAAAVVQAGADATGRGLIVNASRSVIFADDPAAAARALRDALRGAR
jgi:orotidine-5'-phosphate decarboxylase